MTSTQQKLSNHITASPTPSETPTDPKPPTVTPTRQPSRRQPHRLSFLRHATQRAHPPRHRPPPAPISTDTSSRGNQGSLPRHCQANRTSGENRQPHSPILPLPLCLSFTLHLPPASRTHFSSYLATARHWWGDVHSHPMHLQRFSFQWQLDPGLASDRHQR